MITRHQRYKFNFFFVFIKFEIQSATVFLELCTAFFEIFMDIYCFPLERSFRCPPARYDEYRPIQSSNEDHL